MQTFTRIFVLKSVSFVKFDQFIIVAVTILSFWKILISFLRGFLLFRVEVLSKLVLHSPVNSLTKSSGMSIYDVIVIYLRLTLVRTFFSLDAAVSALRRLHYGTLPSVGYLVRITFALVVLAYT